MYILFMYSLLIFSSMQAADVVNKSPEWYIVKLRTDEADKTIKKHPKFGLTQTVKEHGKNAVIKGCYDIKAFMSSYHCSDYFTYMFEVASSNKLSSMEKIEKARTMIPPLEALKSKSLKIKNEALAACLKITTKTNYPIARLLLAALYRIRADINTAYSWGQYPLLCNIKQNDIPMIAHALDFGANPNIQGSLNACLSTQAAKLLLHRARPTLNLQTPECSQTIEKFCCLGLSQKENSLIVFLLQKVILDESNAYGKQWLDALSTSIALGLQSLPERIHRLLAKGCHYDEQTKKAFFDTIEWRYQQILEPYMPDYTASSQDPELSDSSDDDSRLFQQRSTWTDQERERLITNREQLKIKLSELFAQYNHLCLQMPATFDDMQHQDINAID